MQLHFEVFVTSVYIDGYILYGPEKQYPTATEVGQLQKILFSGFTEVSLHLIPHSGQITKHRIKCFFFAIFGQKYGIFAQNSQIWPKNGRFWTNELSP